MPSEVAPERETAETGLLVLAQDSRTQQPHGVHQQSVANAQLPCPLLPRSEQSPPLPRRLGKK